jgi:hypothetical protein
MTQPTISYEIATTIPIRHTRMAYKNKKHLLEELELAGHDTQDTKDLSRDDMISLLNGDGDHADGEDTPDPVITDPEWTDHVLSHLTDKELIDGMPTCDGLRRVFRLLIGDIVGVQVHVPKPPTLQDPSATVVCSVQYRPHNANAQYQIMDVFDVNSDNTPWPYNRAATASASTKAEARVLRKGLGLTRVYSSEEVQQGMEAAQELSAVVSNENRPIADNAKTAIVTMSQRFGVDVSKLISHMELGDDKNIDQLSYKESHQVIAQLNKFGVDIKKGGSDVPDEIKNEVLF